MKSIKFVSNRQFYASNFFSLRLFNTKNARNINFASSANLSIFSLLSEWTNNRGENASLCRPLWTAGTFNHFLHWDKLSNHKGNHKLKTSKRCQFQVRELEFEWTMDVKRTTAWTSVSLECEQVALDWWLTLKCLQKTGEGVKLVLIGYRAKNLYLEVFVKPTS